MTTLRQRLDRLERARAKRRNGTGFVVVLGSEESWSEDERRRVAEAKARGQTVFVLSMGNIDPERL